MAATDDVSSERFYHGTKADLKPGDLIQAGFRPNYGNLERQTTWVYLTGTLEAAIWGAELALGDGPGRVYVVEPTGPMVDDPDLTDKRFPGNPTKSYCSRDPLRVTGEIVEWQGHSAEALRAMKDHLEQVAQARAALVARIPGTSGFDLMYAQADGLAREWASDARYLGSMILMRIKGADAEISLALDYRSPRHGETHTVRLPHSADTESRPQEADLPLSGRITDVTAWRDGWAATLESCGTEIGLASEAQVLVAIDAEHDKLTFIVDADGPDRSWHRNLQLASGVLSDRERGDIWYFEPAES